MAAKDDKPLRIAVFGDSLTRGRPGVSYLRYLRGGRLLFINRGLGGDTLSGVSRRIRSYLAGNKPDRLIVAAGANDILLPYLRGLSPAWARAVRLLAARGSVPLEDPGEFSRLYLELAGELRRRGIPAALSTIAPLGEDPRSELNRKVAGYNAGIHRAAAEGGLEAIDVNGAFLRELGPGGGAGGYFIHDYAQVALDVLTTSYLPFSMAVSRRRGLRLTVDGVHLNARGARLYADAVRERLSSFIDPAECRGGYF